MTLSHKIAKLIIEKNISVDELSKVLQMYNLLALIPSIRDAVKQISSRTNMEDTIIIESPFTLSPTAISHIKNMTGNDTANHEVIINKNILAGFKARYKGTLYDGSAERIIRQLTK